MPDSVILLAVLIFFGIALLYSIIGHAGASGYLAIMILLSFPTESIKPTSLILNIIVATIASYKFISAGFFDRKIFFSLILFSIPASFLGGYIQMNAGYFKIMAGLFLIISAVLLILPKRNSTEEGKPIKHLHLKSAAAGLGIGFFSGIIGVGGGIFLTPLLIVFKWTGVKQASGISALFILFNSIAGLIGHVTSIQKINEHILFWIPAVIVGAVLGSYLGTKKISTNYLRYLIVIVLFSAGIKFLFFA